MQTMQGKVIAISSPIPYCTMEPKGETQILCYIKMVVEFLGRRYAYTFYSGPDNSINRKACDVNKLPLFILASLTTVGDEVELNHYFSVFGGGPIISMKNLTKGFSKGQDV